MGRRFPTAVLLLLVCTIGAFAGTASAQTRLRVASWNVHHGTDVNAVYKVKEQAAFLAGLDPDVVALQEVERYTGWGNEDQAVVFKRALEAATGFTWYTHFSNHSGSTGTGQQGNLILSRFPFTHTDQKSLPYTRALTIAKMNVNGRSLLFFNVHLSPYSSKANERVTQLAEVSYYLTVYGSYDRFILGDFNAGEGVAELDPMRHWYRDQWTTASAVGKAFGTSATRPSGSRIDYIFFGKYLRSWLALQSADVFETALSDHYALVVEYTVS